VVYRRGSARAWSVVAYSARVWLAGATDHFRCREDWVFRAKADPRAAWAAAADSVEAVDSAAVAGSDAAAAWGAAADVVAAAADASSNSLARTRVALDSSDPSNRRC
jgi:hypothetical protein